MSKVKYWSAINQGIAEEMERDESVLLIGQDVAKPGGTFGETRGLLDRFGGERVRDTPISELAMVGAGIGAATMGLRPIVEILFMDFLSLASDQVINQAAKIPYFSAGRVDVPMVIKTGVGTGVGMGAQHSQSLENWYSQIPGLMVCWGSTPSNAKGLIKSAIRSEGTVIFIESLGSLGSVGLLDEDESKHLPGRSELVREGGDCTVVTYGGVRAQVESAAETLSARHGIETDLIDLQWITPWDRQAVFESVRKTNHCVVVTEAPLAFGAGGEYASAITEECFDYLDAPVARIGAPGIPAPHIREFDEWRIPSMSEVVAVVAKTLGKEVHR